MFVPAPPELGRLDRISPSIYEASTNCLAKAAWFAFGNGDALPPHPAAILGRAFHAVIAAAQKGELSVGGVGDRGPARNLFDTTARELHQRAHPLVKLKFRSADRLPFYNLQRERSAQIATPVAASRLPSSGCTGEAPMHGGPSARTELTLHSKDGQIAGRADHIDGRSGTVLDYKTGQGPEGEAGASAVSDSEARQLRLYAYLAGENGICIDKGVIVRGDGRRDEISISQAAGEGEADRARDQLGKLNAAVSGGASFPDLASPSSKSCAFCPCMPFCGPFWAAAQPEWVADCGSHIEGDVVDMDTRQIQGVSLTTLVLARRAGTLAAPSVSVEQVPSEWMRVGTSDIPRVGETVRVVHGRQIAADESAVVVRVDKTLTVVWRIPRDGADGG